MRVGFDVILELKREIQFHLFPANKADPQKEPLVTWIENRSSSTSVVLLGHLCYQEDLLTKLPPSIAETCLTDAALVLATYQHLGKRGLEELEGEFSLVLWDGMRQELIAMRDPFGCWQLFWLLQGDRLYISTNLQPLTQHLPQTSLDLSFIAQFLMVPAPGSESPTEQTPFSPIRRILPGTMLTFTREGHITQHTWWNWMKQRQDMSHLTLEEAGIQFGNLLKQSVKQRLQWGRVASQLSGGMDSSSVVCLAREWMKAGMGPAKLHTLTSVYQRPSLAAERGYAEMVIQQGGELEPHWVDADEAISYCWFEQGIPYHDEPFMGLPFLSMETLLIEVASQVGIDVILTGIGSDDFICGTGLGIADQLRQGQWRTALMLASQMAREQSSNFWSILVEQGLKPASLLLTLGGPATQLRRGFSKWPHLNEFSIAPWILPEFAQKHQMHQIGITNAQQMYGGSAVASANLGAVKALAGDWTSWFLAAPKGIHYSHPFRDARVARFCLQLPPSLKEVPGLPKPVLQTAMRGILPEAIRTRKRGSSFNDCYWLGLSKHLPQLEAMVCTSRIDELGILDKQHLIHCMQQAAVGIGKMPAITRINTTLSLIAWFDQMMESWQHQAESSEVHRLDAAAALIH